MKAQLKTSLINSIRLLTIAGVTCSSFAAQAATELDCTIGSVNSWGTGFTLNNITVTNETGEEVDGWITQIQLGPEQVVSNAWNAILTEQSDEQVATFESQSYNAFLAPEESTSFGLQGTYSGEWIEPSCEIVSEITGTIETGSTSDSLGFNLPDSGQDICADEDGEVIDCPEVDEDYYGQDAQYDSEEMSYTDNGNGTISDNVTGLMWQQSPASDGLSYYEAVEYAENLELGGYDDWRLPTTKELFSISDFTSGWPYINTEYFDLAIDGEVSKDEQYWSEQYVGTTTEGGDDAAFGVNHATGHIKAYAADVTGQFGNYVRVVRGGTYGENEFTDNEDKTVTDNATGLMWSQDDSGYGMVWSDALIYAESSTLAGYDDWRLPNIRELQTIVDYRYSPSASDEENVGPAIDTSYFNITALDPSDTDYETDYGYVWSSTNAYFGGDSLEYYYAWYVAFGTAPGDDGEDLHGAGAARFDTKYEEGPLAEGGERYYNYVRLVRDVK